MNHFEFKPVGQGLFYTGSLQHDTYNFVFDCGTDNKKIYIEKQIDKYTESLKIKSIQAIDFIVISHLHKDHFNGLYDLLHQYRVKKIYLPYLGNNEAVIVSALALSIFETTEETIININEDDTRLFYFMCGLYGIRNSNYFEFHSLVTFIYYNNENRRDVYASETFTVGNFFNPYWKFILIQSRANLGALRNLEAKLAEYLAQYNERNLIHLISKDKNVLNDIKGIYISVFGKGNLLNLTSIILIHYPLYPNAKAIFAKDACTNALKKYIRHKKFISLFDCNYPCFEIEYDNTITILTGDAMLDDSLSEKIKTCSNNKVPLVLQVPHHGAKDNWQTIKETNLIAEKYIIPFGYGNRHRHPHVDTIDDLIKDNRSFYCVTQREEFVYYID